LSQSRRAIVSFRCFSYGFQETGSGRTRFSPDLQGLWGEAPGRLSRVPLLGLLLLGQHGQSNLEGVGSCRLPGDLVLRSLVDGCQESLVHGGSLDSLLELGVRLLQVSLEVSHAVESLHEGLGSGSH